MMKLNFARYLPVVAAVLTVGTSQSFADVSQTVDKECHSLNGKYMVKIHSADPRAFWDTNSLKIYDRSKGWPAKKLSEEKWEFVTGRVYDSKIADQQVACDWYEAGNVRVIEFAANLNLRNRLVFTNTGMDLPLDCEHSWE